ncbi:MAG: serine hydrolase, partial [Candidatus Binatus sp.]
MAHDVFISHSARDKPVADAVCAKLESHGIRCWIAPRDIRPGMEWGAALLEAIDGARVMLLVFSSHANGSPQISREVERAVSKGLVVVPVRVEDVKPTGNLEYFLGTPHWLDAITPPFERHLDYIAESAKFWLERIERDGGGSKAPRPTTPGREAPTAAPAPAAVATPARPKWIVPSIAALVIAIVGAAAFFGTRYFLPKPETALRNAPEHAATAAQTPGPAANAQTPEPAAAAQAPEPAATAQTTEVISAPSPEVFNQIGERAASRSRTPGFAFLVLYQGRVLFSRGYGLADIERKRPVTPNTRFAIGGVSKQFAAASILLLHQRGKLSLDDKLSTWLPQLPNASKITLAMLLYDTSGLHNYPLTSEHQWPLQGPIAADKIFDILATDKPDFEPGSQSAYSNTGYAALAEVVSRISGKSYSEFLETNIFAPLQMSDSGNGYEAQKAGIAVPYRGVGSFSREDGVSLDLYYGAGSIVSTVVDLAKWDRALLSGSILGPASMHSL